MVEVLLDSNFIISCLKKRIYFEEEIAKIVSGAEIVVLGQIKRELEKLCNDNQIKLVDRELAALAVKLIEKFKKVAFGNGIKYADKAILEYCRENKKSVVAVATLDVELRKKLKENLGIKAIYIRGRKGLEIG